MSKHAKKAWGYIIGSLVGVFVLRMFKLAYQRSRLEKVLQSLVGGDSRLVTINQDFVDKLPKTSFDFRGKPTEPLNLILLGESSQIEAVFYNSQWQGSVPITASNWAKAFWAGLRNKPYPDGPMTPYYIYTTPQDLMFQQQTEKKSFRQRHHVRFWRTNFELKGGTKIWLGMASYDKSLRLLNGFKFPYHHIHPDLDAERDYIIKDLTQQGGKEAGRYTLTEPFKGKNDHHDPYFTDGKIVVVDLTGVKVEA